MLLKYSLEIAAELQRPQVHLWSSGLCFTSSPLSFLFLRTSVLSMKARKSLEDNLKQVRVKCEMRSWNSCCEARFVNRFVKALNANGPSKVSRVLRPHLRFSSFTKQHISSLKSRRVSNIWPLFFLIVVYLCLPHFPLTRLYRRPHTPFLSFPSPADPLCRPANGGCACEDEGEESADRRAGHARNTSQRKSLTPWAEAGKTVILFFFCPPFFSPSLVPTQWEVGWAKLSRGSRTNICEKSAVDSLWATGATQQPGFCKWALDICVSPQCTMSIRQGPLAPS